MWAHLDQPVPTLFHCCVPSPRSSNECKLAACCLSERASFLYHFEPAACWHLIVLTCARYTPRRTPRKVVWMIPPDQQFPKWFDKLPASVKSRVQRWYTQLFETENQGNRMHGVEYRPQPKDGITVVTFAWHGTTLIEQLLDQADEFARIKSNNHSTLYVLQPYSTVIVQCSTTHVTVRKVYEQHSPSTWLIPHNIPTAHAAVDVREMRGVAVDGPLLTSPCTCCHRWGSMMHYFPAPCHFVPDLRVRNSEGTTMTRTAAAAVVVAVHGSG